MKSNKRTFVNLICSLMVLATNIIVGFWLSPFIVENIGVEANGFVTLAGNFVTYAGLIVTALNSMAARYIAIEYVNKDFKKANIYYNSVFWGNLLIVAVLLGPAIFFIARLDNIIKVSSEIATDVKILFAFIFFNFFLSTGLPNWDCGTYVSNRLDRDYIPNMVTSVFRCVFLFIIFTVLTPKVYYVGLCATLVTVTLLFVKCHNTHTLTPELRVLMAKDKIVCSKTAIIELVGSGIWNTISNIGNMLLSGLDLIICNVMIGPVEMGILAIAKTIPSYMQQLSQSIRNAFAPELTINYAKGDMEAVFKDLNRAMKITSLIMTIPIAIVIAVGDSFFSLWVPSQDAKLLQILSILSILGYMFTSGTQILYNVFSTANRVKENSIAMITSGVISVFITYLFVKYTNYGIFAVAGVSTAVNLIRNMVFTLPATASYLGYKKNRFFPQVGMTCFCSIILIVCFYGMSMLIDASTWIELAFECCLMSAVGLCVNSIVILNKDERAYLIDKLLSKVKRNTRHTRKR